MYSVIGFSLRSSVIGSFSGSLVIETYLGSSVIGSSLGSSVTESSSLRSSLGPLVIGSSLGSIPEFGLGCSVLLFRYATVKCLVNFTVFLTEVELSVS